MWISVLRSPPAARICSINPPEVSSGVRGVPEPVVLLLDHDDVGVLRDRPEGRERVTLDPVDRVLATEPRRLAMPAVEVTPRRRGSRPCDRIGRNGKSEAILRSISER